MSTTPSQQPTAPQPEESTAVTKQPGLVPSRIEVVGNDRVRIEFQIEDLVSRLIQGASVLSCSGCHACSARESVLSCSGCHACSARESVLSCSGCHACSAAPMTFG